MSQRVRSWIWY